MDQPTRPRAFPPGAAAPALVLLVALGLAVLESASGTPALAQRQLFLRGPGSRVGPSTEVVPTNCVTAPDGSITCDTELKNPPGNTPARPQLDLFEN